MGRGEGVPSPVHQRASSTRRVAAISARTVVGQGRRNLISRGLGAMKKPESPDAGPVRDSNLHADWGGQRDQLRQFFG